MSVVFVFDGAILASGFTARVGFFATGGGTLELLGLLMGLDAAEETTLLLQLLLVILDVVLELAPSEDPGG